MARKKAGVPLLGLFSLLMFASASHGAVSTFDAFLAGTAENPPTGSPGTGTATVVYDSLAHTLSVDVTFSGLLGTTTAAHIHCCIAPPGNVGVATTTPSFPGFPLGVTSGTYSNTFDLTQAASFSAAFVTAHGTPAGAEAALATGLLAGQAYFNIHTSMFAGGEIRGFLEQRQFTFTGTVFKDLDRDGVLDPGEPGVAGVVVTLDLGADGSVDEQAITNGLGVYNAATFIPGTYRLRIIPPAGLVQTSANPPDFVTADSSETFAADFGIAAISVAEIPTLGPWGAIAFGAALAAAAWRRSARHPPR